MTRPDRDFLLLALTNTRLISNTGTLPVGARRPLKITEANDVLDLILGDTGRGSPTPQWETDTDAEEQGGGS